MSFIPPQVSMVGNAMARETEPVLPASILNDIASGRWRDRVSPIRELYSKTFNETGEHAQAKRAVDEMKKRLPGIMWSGLFSGRGDKNLQAYSSLLCADCDGVELTLEIREKLKADPHVYGAFASPTGTGFKVIFYVDGNNSEHYQNFLAVKAHVKKAYGLEVDEACKNIERLCFVSDDPEAFYNPPNQARALHPIEPAKPAKQNAPGRDSRRVIAERLLGAVNWESESRGFCKCPGEELHTTSNDEKHCEVHLNGAPNVHCFHNSCRDVIARMNHELQSQIGKAERPQNSLVNEYLGAEAAAPDKKLERKLSWRLLGSLVRHKQDDPSVLLGIRYLCRGAGLLVCGPTGIGKSSWIMQALILWALCREAFGIKPTRKLKSLLVQAENDEGDLAEMRDGVIAGLNLTPEEQTEACGSVIVVREDERTGVRFFEEIVRPLLVLHRPDLLAIDPALSYLGGDMKAQEVVGGFTRNMLNPLLREFDCGGIVAHHTNKPTSGQEKPDWKANDFAYLGAGSAEWANWARAVLALRSVGSRDVFELHAAKRGSRIGWHDASGKKVFVRHIAHAKEPGVICWRDAQDTDMPKTGRPKEYDPAKILKLLPATGLENSEWQKLADKQESIPRSTFRRMRDEAETAKLIIKSVNGKWIPKT